MKHFIKHVGCHAFISNSISDWPIVRLVVKNTENESQNRKEEYHSRREKYAWPERSYWRWNGRPPELLRAVSESQPRRSRGGSLETSGVSRRPTRSASRCRRRRTFWLPWATICRRLELPLSWWDPSWNGFLRFLTNNEAPKRSRRRFVQVPKLLSFYFYFSCGWLITFTSRKH